MRNCVIVGQNYPDEALEKLAEVYDRIVIFEPLPEAANACRYAYKDSNAVIVFQAACGASFGTATLHRYNVQGLSSSLGTITSEAVAVYSPHYDLSPNGTDEVQVVHLGLILQLMGMVTIDFLLIDAQGMDFTVLKTVEPWIAEGRVGLIQLEADGNGFQHYDGLPDNSEYAIVQWMQQFSRYRPSRLDGRLKEQPDLVFELTGVDTTSKQQ